MFTALAVALLSSPLLARAIIMPSEPTPGTIFNEGTKCKISWGADPEPNSLWKETNIQFMTGDNFQMVHLTTVATVDGSQAGTFEWDCPDVTINSLIYFYQFSSPETKDRTWTGRFGIGSVDGEVTEPTETNTVGTEDKVKWGTGALADPASAEPAPAYLAGGAPANTDTPSTSDPADEEPSASSTPSGPSSPSTPTQSGPSRLPSNADEEKDVQEKPLPNAAQNSSPADSEPTGAGFKGATIDSRLLQTFSVLAVSAAAFTLML